MYDILNKYSSNIYQRFLRNASLIILLIIALTVMGCYSLGQVVGGPSKNYSETFSISLPSARPDILDIVSEVGESLGYAVQARDKGIGFIRLSSDPSMAALLLIGKMNTVALDVRVMSGGTVLQTTVGIAGNFGAAGPKQAAKLMEDFKAKLLERIEKT